MPICDVKIDRQIATAKSKAKAQNETWAVVSLDDGTGLDRDVIAVPYSYLDEDEYEAFDGRLVYVVYPSGNVE